MLQLILSHEHATEDRLSPLIFPRAIFRVSYYAMSCIGRGLVAATFLGVAQAGRAAAVLDASLSAYSAAGSPIQLVLTVTNTGDVDAANVAAQAWTEGSAAVSTPTPDLVATLAVGDHASFAWTATPTAAGSVVFTASATADGGVVSPQASATVAVDPPAIEGALSWSRTFANPGQGTLVWLTVTNTGGAPLTNIVPQLNVAGPATASIPSPLSVASLVAGQATTFTWSLTATANGLASYTVNASADGPLSLPLKNGVLAISPAPLQSQVFTANPAVAWTGQPVVLALTVSNTGGGAVTTLSARAWGNLRATGLPGSGGAAASASTVASLNAGAKIVFTWTVTPQVAGLLVVTATATGGGGNVAPAVSLTVTVFGGAMAAVRLDCGGPAVAGQPVTFALSVTNTGSVTTYNISAQLATAGSASIGPASPAIVASLVPGAQASFVWTVVPQDNRALEFTAFASGFTASPTGLAAFTTGVAEVTLAGIPAPEASESFLFPSPARDHASIAYTMAEPGTVTIRVYNAAGILAASIEETKPAGVQSSALAASKLAPGIYYYILSRRYDSGVSDKVGRRKFAVVH